MAEEFFPLDLADLLDSPETIQFFVADAFESGNPAYIEQAFELVARAKGLGEFAARTGLSVEELMVELKAGSVYCQL
ncbi:DNA-binding protein [Oxalobacteraceae bacterium A2-2]